MPEDVDGEALAQLEAKLRPERIRATLSFAGLYQITHELIKQSVLEQVRGFYLCGFDETRPATCTTKIRISPKSRFCMRANFGRRYYGLLVMTQSRSLKQTAFKKSKVIVTN